MNKAWTKYKVYLVLTRARAVDAPMDVWEAVELWEQRDVGRGPQLRGAGSVRGSAAAREVALMDRLQIIDTYYWWLAEHHSGQGSREYQRLSKITSYYSPSPLARGPEDPGAYEALCERAGCAHDDREE